MKTATITLHIYVEDYENETGEKLTPEKLHKIGEDVNADAATIIGYGAWEAKMPDGTSTTPKD